MKDSTSAKLIDTQVVVETPEGIDLTFQPAGLLPRTLAFIIDTLIRGAIFFAVIQIAGFLGNFGEGLLLIAVFVLTWLYMMLFEVLKHGQTPGKSFAKIRVIHDDGTNITWSSSFIRNLLRTVDMLPIGYTVGFFSIALTKRFKRIGDIAAGTMVVYVEPVPVPSVIPKVPVVTPPINLTAAEQQAILAYAGRINDFTHERQVELASHLAKQLQCTNEQAVMQILGMALYLQGQS